MYQEPYSKTPGFFAEILVYSVCLMVKLKLHSQKFSLDELVPVLKETPPLRRQASSSIENGPQETQ